jgi:diketogulonate reductase-like aldo/keto reductase
MARRTMQRPRELELAWVLTRSSVFAMSKAVNLHPPKHDCAVAQISLSSAAFAAIDRLFVRLRNPLPLAMS